MRNILFCLLVGCLVCCKPSYKNPTLDVDKRVDDLISRMTLDEKISQLMNDAPAIPRLGIPSYNWWSEGLHGVARAGNATVFPQAIGLAATFDDSLMLKTASIISEEFRASYNKVPDENKNKQYYGLTVWSPNVNIFRDPRWGRGQETYGEDPYLTSQMGVAFVKGLQGNDPKYFKTIATPKHYVVHSGPEPLRHIFNAECSDIDLFETYTPAFKACIVEGKAFSIMGAYNEFRGQPCNANNYLLNDILRNDWGFQGYVVSDCDAILDIYENHKYVGTAAEAAAAAVKNGCDLECGYTYRSLMEAVEKGLITEAEIDVAVKRLFEARFRLGMFDPVEDVPYNKISPDKLECNEHQQAALEASLKSIVLLKNNGILPLDKSKVKKIAIIGPNANKTEVMYGNYNGFPSNSITPLEGIRQLAGETIEVNYSLGCNLTEEALDYNVVDSQMLYFDDKPGVYMQFYDNLDLKGAPVATRIEKEINCRWNSTAPDTALNKEFYSARFRSVLKVREDGKYALTFTGDDGYRVYLNNELIMDSWKKQASFESRYVVDLKKDKDYALKIEYFQDRGSASVRLEYALFKKNAGKEAIELASESDVIIFYGGISPKLEGEEMSVPYEGFDHGDRITIALPEYQENYMKRLAATGKPIIFVMMNGSALAVNWANEHAAAIVESWYPGQDGGLAIAKVLFGEYNPGGKLPITFYRSEKDIPSFDNYDMAGRTYRYYNGPILYPFGYGLSYTTFDISGASVSENTIAPTDSLDVSVTVENTGKIAGDEVVQLYIRNKELNANGSCYKTLKRFRRVTLQPGESQAITFKLLPEDFKYYNMDAKDRIVSTGDYEILVGNSSADTSLKSTMITVK